VLASVGRGGRARRDETGGLLTGAQATAERRRRKLRVARALERGSKLESEVARGGGGWGWCSPYIGARGAPGRGGNGQRYWLNAIDGWGGLRRGLTEGFRAGELKLRSDISMLEDGQWKWSGAVVAQPSTVAWTGRRRG
jgi:hypothetical protein